VIHRAVPHHANADCNERPSFRDVPELFVIASQRVDAKRRLMTGCAKQSRFTAAKDGWLHAPRNDGRRLATLKK
jgi:hypothetical protein